MIPDGLGPSSVLTPITEIKSGASRTAFKAPWAILGAITLFVRSVRSENQTPMTVAKTTIIRMPDNGNPGYPVL